MAIIDLLYERTKPSGQLETIDLLGRSQKYTFSWNEPISLDTLNELKNRYGLTLPREYEQVILKWNGAILFNDAEGAGYQLLSLAEALQATAEMRSIGYEFPDSWLVILKPLFCEDILVLDMIASNGKCHIIDGDIGYPIAEWKHLNGDLEHIFVRLFQANGAMYWRW